ncbi:Glycosyltransferase WbsX [Candidatus Electrothrix laxa]
MKVVAAVIIAQLIIGCHYLDEEPSHERVTVKAGAYYFDGWTGKTNSTHLTRRLKEEFGYREPSWGWITSTPEIMRKQINCAADYGLQFFAFCWYYPEGTNKTTPLNNALDLFLDAQNQKRMEFCLLVSNHAGFKIGPKEWDQCCARWLKLFKHPSYVKANGKPLLIIFSPQELNKSFGGPQAVQVAFERLRDKAREAGLPGVSIAGCWTARYVGPKSTLPVNEVESGYTFVTGYAMPNYCAWAWPNKLQPYQYLLDGHKKAWDILERHSVLPYIPVATLGWDKRPWEKPNLPEDRNAVYYPDRSPNGVKIMVENAVQWISKHPDRTSQEKLLLMYAWNEYGEGSYLTPSKRDGYSFLEAVKSGLHSQTGRKDGISARSNNRDEQ